MKNRQHTIEKRKDGVLFRKSLSKQNLNSKTAYIYLSTTKFKECCSHLKTKELIKWCNIIIKELVKKRK